MVGIGGNDFLADRLFVATIPDADTAFRIYRLAGVLKRAHKFSGKLMEPDRLHISLFFLGGLSDQIVRSACERFADVRMQPFEVSFDRTVSFRGKAGSRPFVLIGDDGPSRLKSFRQSLGAAMTSCGLRRLAKTNFTPHVTLLYDSHNVAEHPIELISWTVNEFVLINSRNGHDHLARWSLRK